VLRIELNSKYIMNMYKYEPDPLIVEPGLLGNALETQHDIHRADLNNTQRRVLIAIPTGPEVVVIDSDTPVRIGISVINSDLRPETDDAGGKLDNIVRYTDEAVKNLRVTLYNRRNNKWQ